MDTISGGSISTGGVVKLSVGATNVGYVFLPDKTVLTTVSGAIDTTYTGVDGEIKYYTPKNDTYPTPTIMLSVAGSGLTGDVIYNGYAQLNVSNNAITGLIATKAQSLNCITCPALTNIVASNAVSLDATGCALTAKSIGDIIYSAYADNRENVAYDFTAGTNADSDAITAYTESVYGISLADLSIHLQGLGGALTFTIT